MSGWGPGQPQTSMRAQPGATAAPWLRNALCNTSRPWENPAHDCNLIEEGAARKHADQVKDFLENFKIWSETTRNTTWSDEARDAQLAISLDPWTELSGKRF